MQLTKKELKQIIKEELESVMSGEEEQSSDNTSPAEAQQMAKGIFTPESGLEYWHQGLVLLSDSGVIPELDEDGTHVEASSPSYLKADGLEIHYWSDKERTNQLKKFLESIGIRNYATIRYGNSPFTGDFSGQDKNFKPKTATGVFYRERGVRGKRDGIILFDAQDHV